MDYKEKICIGFFKVPKKTVLIHENILNGKTKVLSSGLKFVCGFIKIHNLDIINKQIESISIFNNNNNKFDFNVSLTYSIAGGNHYYDKECQKYYRLIEDYVIEEENALQEDWLGQNNNSDSFFQKTLEKMDDKGLNRWWHENHPVLQYTKYDDDIDNNLLSDIKPLFQEAFNSYNGEKISCSNKSCRELFYIIRKELIKKGIKLIQLDINDLVLNDKELKKHQSKSDFVVDYVPIDFDKMKKSYSSNEEFIVDYAPIDFGKRKEDIITNEEFIVDYVPLGKQNKPVEKFVINDNFMNEFETDCNCIDEVFELNCLQDEFEYEDTYDYLYEELDHEDEKNYSKEKVLVLK